MKYLHSVNFDVSILCISKNVKTVLQFSPPFAQNEGFTLDTASVIQTLSGSISLTGVADTLYAMYPQKKKKKKKEQPK